MRATAILFVVISHSLWIFPELSGSVIDAIKMMGIMGVEIFFVLSGFLIGKILYNIFTGPNLHIGQLRYFIIRRWFRTLPNYYIILLINIFIALYFGRDLPQTLWKYFFFLQNATEGMDIFFTESWSLPVEEVAYLIAPFLFYIILLCRVKGNRKRQFLYLTLFILLIFLSTKMVYNAQSIDNDLIYWNIHLKAVVLYRIDAIYYGVLAAYISLTAPKLWHFNPLIYAFCGLILFVGVHFSVSYFGWYIQDFSLFWNVFYLPICSISIAFFLPLLANWKIQKGKWPKMISHISIVSYSMYLLHYSVILQLMRYFWPIEPLSFYEKLVYALLYLGITIIASTVLYKLYEKPMMNLRDLPYFKKMATNIRLSKQQKNQSNPII